MPNTRPLWHWQAYAAEFLGTFLLIFLGLSVVIFDFGPGSPMATWLPDPFLRRLLTGFLFGSVGALVALSPAGRISGAHLDPVLSWAFWLVGSLGIKDALLYTAAQCAGAIAAALSLPPVWGAFGHAVLFGATVPSTLAGPWAAVLGEVIATFALVGGILWFVGHPRLRAFTPALIPPLVAVLVALEAPYSGTSMNPARTLGPAIASHTIGVLWIYLLGPALGALIAAIAVARSDRVHVAKVAHHAHDPFGRFHGAAAVSIAAKFRRFVRALLRRGSTARPQ
ncbi:MAG: aquaporin [Thermaerobacter sp.]|nr:aquaporin [Thermaerobacter sp.]